MLAVSLVGLVVITVPNNIKLVVGTGSVFQVGKVVVFGIDIKMTNLP